MQHIRLNSPIIKLLTLIYLLTFNLAFLQNLNAEEDYSHFSLQDLLTIRIASHQPETIFQAPSNVTVFKASQLKSMGINDLQTLLNYVPGYQSSRDIEQGNTLRISARGRSSALSESVLILMDGQRLNDLYSGGISILNRMLSLQNVKQIEIIRGPGSALYGSNAFLGVINIVTYQKHQQIQLQTNSISGNYASLQWATELSSKQSLSVFLNYFKQSGESYQVIDSFDRNITTKDPISGLDVYLKYQWENFALKLRHMQREQEDFLIFGAANNQVNQENTKQTSIQTDYKKSLNKKWGYQLSLAHTHDYWYTLGIALPAGFEYAENQFLSNTFIAGPLLKSQQTQANIRLNYQLNKNSLFTFGSSLEQSRITDVANVTSHNPVTLEFQNEMIYHRGKYNFNELRKRQVRSLFAQNQYQISPYWQLTTGIRLDDYNDFGQSVNPRAALVWLPQNKNSIKFMYGTAFRAPNFLELYDKNNPVDFGNTELKAEEVETSEVAWLYSHQNWRTEISMFHNHFSNIIMLGEPVVSPLNPLHAPTYTNTQNSHSTGLEFSAHLTAIDNLSVDFNWNWFTKNSDINTERNTGSLILNYSWNDYQINLNTYYRGNNPKIQNQSAYSVSTLNLQHDYNESFSFNIKIENLFDKNYRTLSQVFPTGVVNPGRIIWIGTEIKY